MTRKATGFDRLHEKEAKEAAKAEMEYKSGQKNLSEVRETAQLLATSALRDDLVYLINNGKELDFTPRVKSLFKKQIDDLINHNVVKLVKGNYKCLICGEKAKKGDVMLCETDGSSNAVCFDCLTNKNTYKSDSGLEFIKVL